MKNGLKIVSYIMVSTLILDAWIAAWFFRSLVLFTIALVLTGITSLILFRLIHNTKKRALITGFSIGAGVELSNPERPMPVDNVIIDSSILNLGCLILGGPGSGKTESTLIGFLATLNEHSPGSGCAVFDGKGDIDIYKKGRAVGFQPDYFFSSELPGSDSVNLMEGEAYDVVDRLTRILIGTTASTSYYSDAQRAVISRIIPVLMGLGSPVILRDLYAALYVESAGAEVLRLAKKSDIDPTVISMAEQWFSRKFSERLKEISGLLNRLFIFVNGPYADRLNCYQPDIRVSDIVANNKSIYFHLPLTEFARDVAIAVIEIFGVEARKRQMSGTENLTPFPLFMDDWGKFFYEGFGPFSARCRSAAIPLMFAFQSLAQVKSVSPEFADELDDNLATKFILRVQGEATANYGVRLLDQYETIDLSTSTLGDRSGISYGAKDKQRITIRNLRELLPGQAYVSTLIKTDKEMKNPLYKLQMPLPNLDGWQEYQMPVSKTHHEGQGLGLWQRYINPVMIKKLESDAQEQAQKDAVIL